MRRKRGIDPSVREILAEALHKKGLFKLKAKEWVDLANDIM